VGGSAAFLDSSASAASAASSTREIFMRVSSGKQRRSSLWVALLVVRGARGSSNQGFVMAHPRS